MPFAIFIICSFCFFLYSIPFFVSSCHDFLSSLFLQIFRSVNPVQKLCLCFLLVAPLASTTWETTITFSFPLSSPFLSILFPYFFLTSITFSFPLYSPFLSNLFFLLFFDLNNLGDHHYIFISSLFTFSFNPFSYFLFLTSTTSETNITFSFPLLLFPPFVSIFSFLSFLTSTSLETTTTKSFLRLLRIWLSLFQFFSFNFFRASITFEMQLHYILISSFYAILHICLSLFHLSFFTCSCLSNLGHRHYIFTSPLFTFSFNPFFLLSFLTSTTLETAITFSLPLPLVHTFEQMCSLFLFLFHLTFKRLY